MNRRFALIQALVSIVALAAVVVWALGQDTPQLPSSGHAIAWLVAANALYAVATLLRCERWHRILALTDVHPKRSDTYGLTTVGYMGNNVLPARAGEVLKVVLLSGRVRAGKRELLGTVLAERVLDAIALGSIFVVVVYGILRKTTLPSEKPLLIAGIIVLVGLLALALLLLARRRGVAERIHDFLAPLAGAPRALLSRQGVLLLLASVLIWSVEASTYLAVARSVSLDISATGALYVMAITNLFAMLPAAPGYVGTFDAAVIFGVKAIGGSGSAAFSYLIMLRAVLFLPITLVGLVVLVARYGGWSRLRSAARVEASSA